MNTNPTITREHRKFWSENDDHQHGQVFEPVVVLVVALGLILALFFIVISMDNAPSADAAPALVAHVERGESGDAVTAVQSKLRGFGYSVVVDGVFGQQTERAVRHFQRANGLVVDGVVGPRTSRALGITTGGVASQPATQGESEQVTAPAPPPVAAATGQTGPYYGSAVSGRCTQYEPLLEFFSPGWNIEQFSKIMYRESRCAPDVANSCCTGLVQIHAIHIPNLAVCDVYSREDLKDPGKNICSAAVVYRRAGGTSPWAQTR